MQRLKNVVYKGQCVSTKILDETQQLKTNLIEFVLAERNLEDIHFKTYIQ